MSDISLKAALSSFVPDLKQGIGTQRKNSDLYATSKRVWESGHAVFQCCAAFHCQQFAHIP